LELFWIFWPLLRLLLFIAGLFASLAFGLRFAFGSRRERKIAFRSCVLGFAVSWFVFSDGAISLKVLYFDYMLKSGLDDRGSVRLDDLVYFDWKRVYLDSPYAGTWVARNERRFGNVTKWDGIYTDRYWAILYIKDNGAFFYRTIKRSQFYYRSRPGPQLSESPNAYLRRVDCGNRSRNLPPRKKPKCLIFGATGHKRLPN